jgi:hypothetical protein
MTKRPKKVPLSPQQIELAMKIAVCVQEYHKTMVLDESVDDGGQNYTDFIAQIHSYAGNEPLEHFEYMIHDANDSEMRCPK